MQLETVWHGATWRDFPQPQVAVEGEPRHQLEEVRTYLENHPHRWYRSAELRKLVDMSYDDCSDRLRRLVQMGVAERVRSGGEGVGPGGGGTWQYRLVPPAEKRVSEMSAREYRQWRRARKRGVAA